MRIIEIKQYLCIIFDLEKERYMQNCLLEKLQDRITDLGIPRTFNSPELPENNTKFEGWMIAFGIIGGFIGGGALTFLIYLFNIFNKDFSIFFGGPGDFAIGGLIGAVICGTICTCSAVCSFNNSKLNYEQVFHEYEHKRHEYEQNCTDDQERVKNELKEAAYLKEEKRALEEQMSRTVRLLQELYDLGIIFEKYRWDLVAIATFYEYFCAGRCTELKGHEGAYNTYEMELRLNHIIGRLDIIINSLDTIKNNQYIIYSSIQGSNQRLNALFASTLNIASQVKRIEAQGQDLNAHIGSLQASSDYGILRRAKQQGASIPKSISKIILHK